MTAVTDQRVDDLRRRHAVVLHADVADYSRLMADDPSATVATMRTYHELVTHAVTEVDGTLVNFVGDSFLAVFDDAASGMRAAIRICSAVRERNVDLPRARRAWFRLGLDAGDIVTAADGRHFGDALNIAARIQAIAEVGGINVTETVYRALDEPALRLVPLGLRRLKNIPEPVRVYRLAGVGRPDGRLPVPGTVEPVIAVLGTSHGDDPADRRVADALRAELVAALGAVPGLGVVDGGDNPSGHDGPGASYFLDTVTVRSGERVRFYAKLVELETFNLVWSGRWQGTTDDLFTLQDTVAAETVRAMEVELVVGQPAMIYRTELDAGERAAVYTGWYHLDQGTRDGWLRAVELFESVTRSRPDSVSGHGLTAFARWWGAAEGLSDTPAEDLRTAARHATRGVELGDPSGLSHLVLAALRLHEGGDLQNALADAEQSLAQRPTCDVTLAVLGSVRRYLGDWRAAVEACERAQALSPVRRPWFATVQASAWYVGERYHDAIQAAEWIVDRQPDNLEALLVLAASQQALGLNRRARATVGMLLDRHPHVRRDDLPQRHPFRDADIIARWSAHLAAAGVP
ncbi:MAG TPA: adenylate/guanylate cyclase domain-containing protein [Euzebyales bacterium]|nr:adenylate/guanylate cyclase domain-containing protein [Euzebyales bacterium]